MKEPLSLLISNSIAFHYASCFSLTPRPPPVIPITFHGLENKSRCGERILPVYPGVPVTVKLGPTIGQKEKSSPDTAPYNSATVELSTFTTRCLWVTGCHAFSRTATVTLAARNKFPEFTDDQGRP